MDINNLPKGEFKIIVKDYYFVILDSNRNEIYYEHSTGYWSKREYDSNGKEIYFKNSNGLWAKWEYDSNGNVTYSEDSTGDKYFFDSNGKGYTEQEWNQRNHSCDGKIVTFEGKQYQLKSV